MDFLNLLLRDYDSNRFRKLTISTDGQTLGLKFQAQVYFIGVFVLTITALCISVYDRIIGRHLRKITLHEEGIPVLQRMDILIVFSILSMIVVGVENWRRASAIYKLVSAMLCLMPMHVVWLVLQLTLVGLALGVQFCKAD
ncbi:hypothetical protein Syun_023784 [Stephania yunnanensis]|uniref:Uncharacterized protein n=1 Tax=Stephania yunnanensis TaxID=152371 RepID=A0AAP0HZX6_9MAGN